MGFDGRTFRCRDRYNPPMSTPKDDFLRALEHELDELALDLLAGEELAAEFRIDRAAFLGAEDGDEDAAARRRHLEWFLLERECAAIGSVPLEVAVELRTTHDDDRALRYAALRGSRAGIFVVSRVDPAEGVLLDELLGRGQYVADEPALAAGLDAGDLVVGRIFPRDLATDGERTTWCLSSGAANLRNPQLLEALTKDVEELRARSRGPLRMTQAELEVMFFRESLEADQADTTPEPPAVPEAEATPEPPVPLAVQLERARGLLVGGGLEPERWTEIVDLLRARPMPEADLALGGDDPLGWVLDELAFETDLDLDDARRRLADLWRSLHAEVEPAGSATGPDEAGPADAVDPARTRAALERFDAGRAEGLDVEDLFAALEAELGLDAEPEDDDHRVPDFPGVLGALVQEFLWDGARIAEADLDAFVAEHRELELFVQYGAFLGVADELDLDHLRVFLGRWLWEQPAVLAESRDLARLGASLGAFLTWLAEHHGHAVAGDLAELLGLFERSRERILAHNRTLAQAGVPATGTPVTLRYLGDGSWEDADGGFVADGPDAGILEVGDCLVTVRTDAGLRPRLALPPIGGPHLKASS